MEITPGRAPFTEDEDYTPLRKPKTAAPTVPHPYAAVAGGSEMNTIGGAFQHNYAQYGGGGVGMAEPYGRTVSPSKLSPFAKEFVPRFGGAVGGNASPGGAAQQPPAQPFQQNYHSYQQQQQQRYVNGYHQTQQQQQQQQQQHAAPSPQPFGQGISSLTASVQERLKLTGPNAGGGGGGVEHNKASSSSGPSTSSNNWHHGGPPQGRYNNKPHQQQGQGQGRYNQQQQHHHNHNPHHHQQQHQPRHYQQNQTHHHHNNSNSSHNNNGSNNRHHQQHRGGGGGPKHGKNSNSGGGAGGVSAADMEGIALDYLQTVIECLNQNPGQFDEIATRFLTIFDGMENNQYVLSVAMEDIFQQAIQNPNFRYMGAKLYNLLHMLNPHRDSLFQTLLKCKLDYHQGEVAQYMQAGPQQQGKVRETALFLAELYMQLRGEDEGSESGSSGGGSGLHAAGGQRIQIFADNIVHSLQQLLTRESAENVRCICLTLKLAGYDLSADCGAEMRGIIVALEEINHRSPGKYPLAANVVALQKNNWGRKVSNSLSDITEAVNASAGGAGSGSGSGHSGSIGGPKAGEVLRASDEPVFYGPDGRELTAEEADFLAEGDAMMHDGAGGDDDGHGGDGGDDDGLSFDPEMDEESEMAFKEFCKMNAAAVAAVAPAAAPSGVGDGGALGGSEESGVHADGGDS